MMKTSASELERLQRKKKKNPDPGFTGEILTLGIVRISALLLNHHRLCSGTVAKVREAD